MLYLLLSCTQKIEVNEYSCLLDGRSTTEQWNGDFTERRLLFQSGFENNISIEEQSSAADDIIGEDVSVSELGDWELDLEKEPIGSFQIFYSDGNSYQRSSQLVEDPLNSNNQVIEFRLHEANEQHITSANKGRIQFGLNNNHDLFAFSYSVRIKLEDGFVALTEQENKLTWLTLAEFWNNNANKAYPFRITLNLNKEEGVGQDLFWHVHAQTKESKGVWNNIWEAEAKDVPVSLSEWMTLMIDIKEGCEDTGWFRVRLIDEQGIEYTIVDKVGIMQHPNDPTPDGFVSFNPLKLYTSEKTINWVRENGSDLVVLWDDFELYQGTQD
jgi:hypothetical protein